MNYKNSNHINNEIVSTSDNEIVSIDHKNGAIDLTDLRIQLKSALKTINFTMESFGEDDLSISKIKL